MVKRKRREEISKRYSFQANAIIEDILKMYKKQKLLFKWVQMINHNKNEAGNEKIDHTDTT